MCLVVCSWLRNRLVSKRKCGYKDKVALSGFLLSVAIAGTMNPKAGTTYYAQPVAESLRITDHYGYIRNFYII